REVEMQAALRVLRGPWRAERDERPRSAGLTNGNVAVLVIHDRPPDRLPPEVAGRRMCGLERDRSEEPGVGEELAPHPDAELVALGIGEHRAIIGLWPLPDVDVVCPELEQPPDYCALVVIRLAHELEMNRVLRSLRFRHPHEDKDELRAIGREHADLVASLVDDLPSQRARPESCEPN